MKLYYTPHFHMPINTTSVGYYILAKYNKRDRQYELSAFAIPYAPNPRPGLIACLLTLNNNFGIYVM